MRADRFRTDHLDAQLVAQLADLGIEVVDHLHMVGNESNGHDDDVAKWLLRMLATVSGPTALFPEGEATLSLPDEARELLYLVEPLAVLSHANGRLPRHAGNRLAAAPLAFSLGQSKTSTALDDVAVILRLLMRLPLRQRALTTIRDRDTAPLPAIRMPASMPVSRPAPVPASMPVSEPRRRRRARR